MRKFFVLLLCSYFLSASGTVAAFRPQEEKKHDAKNALIWLDPFDIESRDLYYGSGGPENQPRPPFEFIEEDKSGSNPKFDISDAKGVRWKAKLGNEASPETAAARLLWAVGYFVNEVYWLPEIQVSNMPSLSRGNQYVKLGETVPNVRLERFEKKVRSWAWKDNPFIGTREFNGLRVMMAVINNWDLKDVNTGVYETTDEWGNPFLAYTISDLGASFSDTKRSWPIRRSKGDLKKFMRSGFIDSMTDTTVTFELPGTPAAPYFIGVPDYLNRVGMRWIGQDIPRADARWIGELLGRLSPDQIRDAFRGAGYDDDAVEGFTTVILERIAWLRSL